jgi:hypothetical protein
VALRQVLSEFFGFPCEYHHSTKGSILMYHDLGDEQ